MDLTHRFATLSDRTRALNWIAQGNYPAFNAFMKKRRDAFIAGTDTYPSSHLLDLSGEDLSGRDLSRFEFANADTSMCNVSGSRIDGHDFFGKTAIHLGRRVEADSAEPSLILDTQMRDRPLVTMPILLLRGENGPVFHYGPRERAVTTMYDLAEQFSELVTIWDGQHFDRSPFFKHDLPAMVQGLKFAVAQNWPCADKAANTIEGLEDSALYYAGMHQTQIAKREELRVKLPSTSPVVRI